MSEKHYPTDPLGLDDAGDARYQRPPTPCACRLSGKSHDGWCTLDDGHAGDCFGKRTEHPAPSRFDKGRR